MTEIGLITALQWSISIMAESVTRFDYFSREFNYKMVCIMNNKRMYLNDTFPEKRVPFLFDVKCS